jgi:hypothetical protein
MTGKKKPQREIGWKVLRMRGAGAVSIEFVYARDEADAVEVEKAIEKFCVPEALQNRIVVRP